MTLRELSQLYWLKREIEDDLRRLARLRELAESPPAPGLSGMPGQRSGESRPERYAVRIADLEAVICAKMERCVYERGRLEGWIARIPDSLTRQIFTLRFVEGLSWVRVARRVGGGNSEDGVKKRCYRYLRRVRKDVPNVPK